MMVQSTPNDCRVAAMVTPVALTSASNRSRLPLTVSSMDIGGATQTFSTSSSGFTGTWGMSMSGIVASGGGSTTVTASNSRTNPSRDGAGARSGIVSAGGADIGVAKSIFTMSSGA